MRENGVRSLSVTCKPDDFGSEIPVSTFGPPMVAQAKRAIRP